MKSSEPIRASSKGKLDLDAAFRVGGVGTAVVAVTGDDIARRGCRSPDGVVGRARLDGHAVKKVAQLVAVVGDTVRVGDPPGNVGAYVVALHLVARRFGIRDADTPSAVAGDYVARSGRRPPDGVVQRVGEGHADGVAQLVAVVGDTVRVGDPPGNIGAYEVAPHRVARGIDAQEDAILPIVDDESLYRAVVGLDLESV